MEAWGNVAVATVSFSGDTPMGIADN